MGEAVYVEQTGGLVVIGNALVELGFDISANGALVSLLDKRTGYQLLRHGPAPKTLFRVALRRPDRSVDWLDSREGQAFHWKAAAAPGAATLSMEVSAFGQQTASVGVEVTLRAGSPLSAWRMRVQQLGDAAVHELACPIVGGVLKVGDPAPGECIAASRFGEGYLFREPYPVRDHLPLKAGAGPDAPRVGMGELHGLYPNTIAMQLMLYYNDHAGLYLAAHDAGGNTKRFELGRMPGEGSRPVMSIDMRGVMDDEQDGKGAGCGPYPIMSISHLPSEEWGQDIAFDYETVVGVFHGDWYDGAAIYKAWATQQWWCAKKLWERDIADWMRTGFAVFQMANYHLPALKLDHSLASIASVVNQVSGETGVPVLGLIFNYEGHGGWTGPFELFPPREGEEAFRTAMARLEAAGNHGFVFIPGGYWFLRNAWEPPSDTTAPYDREARPYASVRETGEVHAHGDTPFVASRLCPHTNYVADVTRSLVLGCLERGCPVVQIDNFPGGTWEGCYSHAHGHPVGLGAWWSEAWNRILIQTRQAAKALNPSCALSGEGIAEVFIPHLDMYDNRTGNMEYYGHAQAGDPMGGEVIPLFGYVYHDYIGAFDAPFPECNRPEVLYWTRCFGKALAHGVVPTGGWYYPEPDHLNPTTYGFYKRVVRAAVHDCWKYVMFGEMLRPPAIDVPRIQAWYLEMTPDYDRMDVDRPHRVEDWAVQHSAWRARDGSVGYLFVNISEAPVEFSAEISAHSERPGPWRLEQVVDGRRELLLEASTLPLARQIRMEPLSVLLVEVRRGE